MAAAAGGGGGFSRVRVHLRVVGSQYSVRNELTARGSYVLCKCLALLACCRRLVLLARDRHLLLASSPNRGCLAHRRSAAAVVASRAAAAAKAAAPKVAGVGREGLARAALRSISPLLEIGAAVLRTGRRQTGAVLPCQRPWRRRRRRRRPRWPWVSSSAGCRRQRGALSGVLSLCGLRPRRPLPPDHCGALSAACRAVLCFVDRPVRAAAAHAPNTRNNNTHRRRPASHAPVYKW